MPTTRLQVNSGADTQQIRKPVHSQALTSSNRESALESGMHKNVPGLSLDLLEDLPLDQQEDESDLDGTSIEFKDAVVMSADWTIETLNGQMHKGIIELDPAFQRRAAWDVVRKSRLVESVIVGMPIPNIVLADNKNFRGRFIVIDGKQRLLSIRDFAENKFPLEGLDLRSDLNSKRYSDLHPSDREYFDNSTFRSSVIKNWQDERFLYATFFRLNSGSMPLSPQELRRALVGGRFLEAIDDFIVQSVQFRLVIAQSLDRRMRDSELVLRFVAFDRALPEYAGNLKEFLDETTRYFEADWARRESEAQAHFERLERALLVSHRVFGKHVFRKWIGDRYEKAINRAIFDCIARFFADPKIAAAVNGLEQQIKADFEVVSLLSDFKESVERTTKSITATNTRVDIWGEKLALRLNGSYNAATKQISL